MTNDDPTFEYRVASSHDETDMYEVIEEVAPEIPVLLDTEGRQNAMRGIIVECHRSGKSWVAVDANGKVVGCVLARSDFHEDGALSLRYIGVSKDSRRHGISAALIEKLKTEGLPLTASVLRANKSSMATRLAENGFTEEGTNDTETKFRWNP